MRPAIFTYTAGEAGLFVNSYLLETDEGVVAIDGSLLVSDSRAFRARLQATKKPLLAVLVTHGHPDHFNGIVELVRDTPDVPIYATAQGKQVIEEVADAKRAQWGPIYGDEWPSETVPPDHVVGDGESLDLGGVRVRAHEVGPCESASEALFVVEAAGAAPVAFTGDLFYDGYHPYNADGFSGAWLDALDRAAALLDGVSVLYPGHGRPAGIGAIGRQREYQLMLREAVRNLARGESVLSEGAKEQLVARMARFWPDAGLQWLVGLSADPVAAELAREPQTAAA